MSEDRRRILDMLAQGKISADEAERLLDAIGSESAGAAPEAERRKPKPKFLRVVVDETNDGQNPDGDKVDIRVPLALLRAGIKLAGVLPPDARSKVNSALDGKGISLDLDLGNAKPEHIEELVDALADLSVDVGGKESVRVFCE